MKKLTIDEKIQFWRDVMQLAKDRGVDVYWFTWNVFLCGAEGKDGITRSHAGRESTIEYFRASVRETIKTYPLLAGFGITAGESMDERQGRVPKEQWLWQTYGEGIRDALGNSPAGKFRLIHRFHMTRLGRDPERVEGLPRPARPQLQVRDRPHVRPRPRPASSSALLQACPQRPPHLAHRAQ